MGARSMVYSNRADPSDPNTTSVPTARTTHA
jgi:hypothetical protein